MINITTKYWSNRFALSLVLFLSGLGTSWSQTIDTILANDTYVIENNYPIQSLADHTSIFLDDTHLLTIEDILNADSSLPFIPLTPDLYRVDTAQTVWLKVQLNAEIDLDQWWLILNARSAYSFLNYIQAPAYMEVFFTRGDSVIKTAKSGTLVPASEKDIPEKITIGRVYLNMEAGQTITLYLRLKGSSSNGPFMLPTFLELRDPAIGLPDPFQYGVYYREQAAKHITFIFAIYVLCIFFYTFDRAYLFLFGWFTFRFIHHLILFPYIPLIEWVFPENPRMYEILWIILTTGDFIFLLQFGRQFLNLKKVAPKIDKLLFIGIGVTTLIGLSRLGIYYFLPGWHAGTWIVSQIVMDTVLFLITVRLFSIKQYPLVRFFVFGTSSLIAFYLLAILWIVFWQMGIRFPVFNGPQDLYLLGQIIFMLTLLLGIAHKIWLSQQAQAEVEKVRFIDSIKSKFFANISHEFRTPLSLILGPVNQSLASIPASDSVEDDTEIPVKGRHLKIMKRNALRLQNLVDQILDLSKLDQSKMQLRVSQGDIIQFVRSIIFSFESLAERRHIHFKTHFSPTIPDAYFDRDKLEKILVNLLSNAFKFTDEHGEVSVRVEQSKGRLKIVVADSGRGMNAQEVEKIFDRFFQIEGTHDKGTGIGLSLVKELVELYRGQIWVNSTEGSGTTFKISIPFRQSDFRPEEIVYLNSTSEPQSFSEALLPVATNGQQKNAVNSDLPLLLIVEDNPDLSHYISEQMETDFQIITAKDGEEGLKLAKTKVPDLIISDIMMPKMNGLDLCTAIKSDVKTSHVPVILLTAKAGRDAKLEGLETGADDYLTKPFDGRELKVRARNIIEQRQALREKFTGELKVEPSGVVLNSMDEQFISDVKQIIEANIGNESFTVEDLSRKVGFSRWQLNRKIKSLTGKTSNQLIRYFRLFRAKELLEQQTATVSEVAYQVGYSNLSYFSKSYKEAFGVLPKDTTT